MNATGNNIDGNIYFSRPFPIMTILILFPQYFRKCTVNSPADYEQISSLLPSEEGGTKQHSDSGSVDSHNDSGYGTRMGQSSSSPELTDSDIHHHHHHHQAHSPYYSQVTQYNPYIYTNNSVVISPSSLV